MKTENFETFWKFHHLVYWKFLNLMNFLKVQNFKNFKKVQNFQNFKNFKKNYLFYNFEIFENFEMLWMSRTQFDWSTQLDFLALVGRWESPNIPHARCTHSEVELRKCCLGHSEKSKIPYHLIKFIVK
jgi:hypothetical protein